jgi:hypothetical protein
MPDKLIAYFRARKRAISALPELVNVNIPIECVHELGGSPNKGDPKYEGPLQAYKSLVSTNQRADTYAMRCISDCLIDSPLPKMSRGKEIRYSSHHLFRILTDFTFCDFGSPNSG